MSRFYQFRVSKSATDYYKTFGSIDYIVHRLIKELGEEIIGLPNCRLDNKQSCNRYKIEIKSIDLPKYERQGEVFLSRVMETGFQLNTPIVNKWPENPSLDYQQSYILLTSLTDDELLQLWRCYEPFIHIIV